MHGTLQTSNNQTNDKPGSLLAAKHFREALDRSDLPASAKIIGGYTPVSAIMHHALGDKCPVIKRPKGAKGRVKTDFMWPDDAFPILDAADKIDAEFGLYLRLLLYTGIRKSEGLTRPIRERAV